MCWCWKNWCSYTKNNKYSNAKNTVGYYLNNTYLKTLDSKNIIKSNWYIGALSLDNLDYSNEKNTKGIYIGGILSYSNGATLTKNYYLTGTASVGIYSKKGSIQTSDVKEQYEATSNMPSVISIINGANAFVEDTDNMNDGYPVFSWQVENKIY